MLSTRPGQSDAVLKLLDDIPTSGAQSALKPAGTPMRTGRRLGFALAVLLPTLLAVAYFAFLAADRFEVEARFVIRSPGAALGGALQGLVQGGKGTQSIEDAYVTQSYLTSRDAMKDLLKEVDLIELLGRPRFDLLWHYPGPFWPHSEERLYQRLRSHVAVAFDRTTGVSTLNVQAFTPEDAQAIARALLKNAEALVNRLSERGLEDAIASAKADVEGGRVTAAAVQERLTEFRRKNAIIDPGKVSSTAQENIARLALETARIGASVTVMERSSPNSPQIEGERVRMAALKQQIDKERESLAGSEASLAPLMAEYETLILERAFAEQAFASALAALETARSDGLRQRFFLEQISAPNLPDYAAYPQRMMNVLLVVLVAWGLYGILARLYLDTRAHADD